MTRNFQATAVFLFAASTSTYAFCPLSAHRVNLGRGISSRHNQHRGSTPLPILCSLEEGSQLPSLDPAVNGATADLDEYKTEIRRTFNLVKPISTQAAAIFYSALWEINPSTKVLFKNTDMSKQGVKLMQVLGVAVSMLDKTDKLVPILQDLGRNHVSYGVTNDMYPSVEKALLVTLDKGLGDECTPKTTAAWAWVLGGISEICVEAASGVIANNEKGKGDAGGSVVAPPAVPVQS